MTSRPQTHDVVTCFLTHGGKVLVLRRSPQLRTFAGMWAGVSGYIEAVPPLEQALQEIEEETGLGGHQVRLLYRGTPLEAQDPQGTVWRVHPFLFALLVPPSEVRLDWEHSECRWVDPEEIKDLNTVPKLAETWERVASGFSAA